MFCAIILCYFDGASLVTVAEQVIVYVVKLVTMEEGSVGYVTIFLAPAVCMYVLFRNVRHTLCYFLLCC